MPQLDLSIGVAMVFWKHWRKPDLYFELGKFEAKNSKSQIGQNCVTKDLVMALSQPQVRASNSLV